VKNKKCENKKQTKKELCSAHVSLGKLFLEAKMPARWNSWLSTWHQSW